MSNDLTRRGFLGTAGTAAAIGSILETKAEAAATPPGGTMKIIAVSGSLRKGKTTAAALGVCLEAAKAVDAAQIEVELVELVDYKLDDAQAVAAAKPGQEDDMSKLVPKLADPRVGGIILGSPTYFGNMSGLLKTFLDRWIVFRKDLALSNKVGGALAVAGNRNGGQEQVLRSIHTSLFAQEMIIVGDGRPTCHWGGTLWNNSGDNILKDDVGVATARNLGRRVAEVARLVRRA